MIRGAASLAHVLIQRRRLEMTLVVGMASTQCPAKLASGFVAHWKFLFHFTSKSKYVDVT